MDLGLYVTGEASKRGLVPRLPGGHRLMGDADTWLSAEAHDVVRSTRLDRNGDDDALLFVDLHPAGFPMRLHASDDGAVDALAITSAVGPGYHTYVHRLIQKIGAAMDVEWANPDGAAGETGMTRFVTGADRATVEREMLHWLGNVLRGIQGDRSRGGDGFQVSLPARTRFTFDGVLATPLGPRDDAWLSSALERPDVAIDVWPWWSDAVDARSLLGRALCLMWSEIRWRPPGVGEGAAIDEVLELLRRAYTLDPSLDYPWTEWAELIDHARYDAGLVPMVRRKGESAAARPPIGYRRSPVTISHEGWSLTVPGSFSERWTSEEWWGGESGRAITVAATTTEVDGRPMPPEAFLAMVAGDLGAEAITHRDERVVGRARLTTDASSGVEVGVVDGYSAVVGSGAAIRVVFDDPADWEWALDMWRSLRPSTA